MCITSATISCDDRRKLNIKHVLKSAPLPTSLQHSAKQYNLKKFHAFFPSLFICNLHRFLIVCFFSIYFSQLSSFHIYNTNLHTHFAIYKDKILPYACTLYSHSQQEKDSISIYAFVLILCMFTMYVCCIICIYWIKYV